MKTRFCRLSPVVSVARAAALVAAFAVFGGAAFAGVLDDAKFILDLRGGENTYKKPGDIGNALDYSSSSPCVGYMGDFRGAITYGTSHDRVPQQLETEVVNPYYPATTYTQNALHFYQDTDSSSTRSVRTGVCISNAAVNAQTVTFYVRFKWDGVATANSATPCYIFENGKSGDGWHDTGVALNIDGVSVSGTTTNACLGFRGAKSSSKMTSLAITAGTWNDAFITFAQNADNPQYTVTASVCTNSASKPTLKSESATESFALSFATPNIVLGTYHNSAGAVTPSRGFRGDIAEFMAWERALTDEEKFEVMAAQHGSKWTVGALNGSADEFTDDDPAAVFEPESMPWRRMRRTLTAANPALSLKSSLASFEAGKPMIFSVTPLLSGVSAAPVSLSVNGTQVGSAVLSNARTSNIVIPGKLWTRDGEGNVTVTFARTDTAGSVAIDALRLSGSWQSAAAGDGASGTDQSKAAAYAFAGDADVSHFTRSMSVGNRSTNYVFGVYVPAGMGERCGWTFRTRLTSRYNASNLTVAERHVLSVNGTAVATHEGNFGATESFEAEIPAGTLVDGMNYVSFAQTAPSSGKDWMYFDYWAMDLIPPPNPFVIVVR